MMNTKARMMPTPTLTILEVEMCDDASNSVSRERMSVGHKTTSAFYTQARSPTVKKLGYYPIGKCRTALFT